MGAPRACSFCGFGPEIGRSMGRGGGLCAAPLRRPSIPPSALPHRESDMAVRFVFVAPLTAALAALVGSLPSAQVTAAVTLLEALPQCSPQ